jgi:Flp pilus assembly protein TadD
MARSLAVRADRAASGVAYGAERPSLRQVWSADNFDAPAVLERGAPAHIVAFHRAYMRLEAGQSRLAIAAFREAIQLKPDFAEAHYNLGIALAETGQLPDAIAAYRKAIELKPGFAEAHCNLGMPSDHS